MEEDGPKEKRAAIDRTERKEATRDQEAFEASNQLLSSFPKLTHNRQVITALTSASVDDDFQSAGRKVANKRQSQTNKKMARKDDEFELEPVGLDQDEADELEELNHQKARRGDKLASSQKNATNLGKDEFEMPEKVKLQPNKPDRVRGEDDEVTEIDSFVAKRPQLTNIAPYVPPQNDGGEESKVPDEPEEEIVKTP